MKLSVEEARALLQLAVQHIAEPIQRTAEIMEMAAEGESRIVELERAVGALTDKIAERRAVLNRIDAELAGRVRACEEAIAAKQRAAELDQHGLHAKIAEVKRQLDEAEHSATAQIAGLQAAMEAKQKEHDVFVGKMDLAMQIKQGEFTNLSKVLAELIRKHGLHAHA